MWKGNWCALCVAVCLAAISPVEARAQDRYLDIVARFSRAQVLHEAVVLPDEDRARAVVTFRVPNSLLVFVQERDGFVSDAEVAVELYRGNRKVDEGTRRERHVASTFEETQSRSVDFTGTLPFAVEPGDYAYRLTVGGEAVDGPMLSGEFTVPDFAAEGAAGSLVFGRLERGSRHVTFTPIGFGGDAPFGENVTVLVPVVLSATGDSGRAMPRFELYRVSATGLTASARRGAVSRSGGGRSATQDQIEVGDDGELIVEGVVETEGLLPIGALLDSGEAVDGSHREAFASEDSLREAARSLADSDESSADSDSSSADSDESSAELNGSAADRAGEGGRQNPDSGEVAWRSSDAARMHLAVLPIRTEHLESGTYVLHLTLPGSVAAEKYVFSTLWRDMPLSLFDVGVAIRHLEYIEDRETVRALLKGTRDDQIAALAAYWKDRDPTPGTVLNELMLEYYRRIDQAALKFQTGRHSFPDGLRTDAARIYVVHGAPNEIANTLPASGGIEQTWTYPDGRRFIFWAANSMAPLELQERKSIP